MIIPVKTQLGEYSITFEKGILERVDEILNLNRKVLIVTDSGVPSIYAETVAKKSKEPTVYTIEQGEKSKNIKNFEKLLEVMVENGFTRTDCVVAVGGGVVGDLSGFVAASFMRGVDFYNIPTTVLSQVDSSIGGKVAVDFCGFKNIVGAFYQPKAVVIDTLVLKTLPDRQISNGLAEAVKMSLTSDKELFSVFENEDIYDNLDLIIERSIKIKRSVVQKDEKESGLRKILNFGHTIAHAIETSEGLENYYHGECVAIGMLHMCSADVEKRVRSVLQKLNLPLSVDVTSETLINAVKHDKKVSGENITVIYVEKVGEFVMKDLPLEDYLSILKKAGL